MSGAETLLLIALGAAAGAVGALAGLGGGIIITPVLAMYFGLPMHQAIGVSLVAVIATSTSAASVNVERKITDIDLGITLELATTIGAAVAAVIAGLLSQRALAILFICFLLYSAGSMIRRAWATRKEELEATIPAYAPTNYPAGLVASVFAGGFSGLLGVGGGVVKVPVMYLLMKVPLRVATATSNFTIGVTAAASAFIYYVRGDVNVAFAVPILAGVFAGSFAGARLAHRVRSTYVLFLFVGVTAWMAVQMTFKLRSGVFG
jgi:uncharacterized membrane protein YfcA